MSGHKSTLYRSNLSCWSRLFQCARSRAVCLCSSWSRQSYDVVWPILVDVDRMFFVVLLMCQQARLFLAFDSEVEYPHFELKVVFWFVFFCCYFGHLKPLQWISIDSSFQVSSSHQLCFTYQTRRHCDLLSTRRQEYWYLCRRRYSKYPLRLKYRLDRLIVTEILYAFHMKQILIHNAIMM